MERKNYTAIIFAYLKLLYDLRVKSGRVTGCKPATNSLKVNAVVLVNEMLLIIVMQSYL